MYIFHQVSLGWFFYAYIIRLTFNNHAKRREEEKNTLYNQEEEKKNKYDYKSVTEARINVVGWNFELIIVGDLGEFDITESVLDDENE